MSWRTRVPALLAAATLAFLIPAAPALADTGVTVPKGTTVVTFTFDDGWKDQLAAAQILEQNHMHGTFYINSGQLNYPAYLSIDELKGLADRGHEVAGHTIDHPDLTKQSSAQVRDEICNDRATLIHLGFKVKDFAFPYGAGSPTINQVVKQCGYVSARRTSGLKTDVIGCEGCPYANPLPPETDYWSVRTSTNDASLKSLKNQVTQVQKNGGGWLPLVFHHVCSCPERGKDRTTLVEFVSFISWLKTQPKVQTYTIDQMIGGPNKPAVGEVIARWTDYGMPPAAPGVEPTAQGPKRAFTVLGVGVGQGTVISTGLIIATVSVFAYRFGARGHRYKSAGH